MKDDLKEWAWLWRQRHREWELRNSTNKFFLQAVLAAIAGILVAFFVIKILFRLFEFGEI